MFKCDKVENILVRSFINSFEVKGIVGASYSKDRYQVFVRMDTTGTKKHGQCSCKAGAMGLCKHIAALLFTINDYKQSGQKEIKEEVACTEKPRQWGTKKVKSTLGF